MTRRTIGPRDNFYYLFAALLILIIVGPVLAESLGGLEGHEGHAHSRRLVYFSFVTLTTLGYGDVLPLTVYAETLTIVEALLGQFYLAVLVAGLIGAYFGDRDRRPDPKAMRRESTL